MEGPLRNRLARLACFVDRHQLPLACLVSIAILLALHQSLRISNLPYDAGEYWQLSAPGVLGTVKTHRGYFFPMLLLPLYQLYDAAGASMTTVRVGASVVYGIALPVLVPAVFRQAFGGTVSFWRRLVPVVLLALLFPGLLVYPLSDLPALLMAMAALFCLLRAMQGAASRWHSFAMMGAAGVLMGAAYNTRTIYLFTMLGMAVLLAIRGLARGSFPRWLGIVAFATGLVAVSLPQLVINRHTHGVSSLAVISRIRDSNLFVSQLVWGITLQRYETSLVATAPSVYYFDPAGVSLFIDLAAQRKLFTLRGYFAAVAKHPLEFLGLYARHAINGLDVRDGMVYTRKPSPLRNRTAFWNFCVLALAGCVAWSIGRRRVQPQAPGFRPAPAGWPLSLALLMLPVAAIVPGAVETRFFLPLHLLAYCVIAFHFDAALLRQSLRTHGGAIAVAVAAAACVFFGVTLTTMSQLQPVWPDIYRHGPPQK